MKRTIEFNYQDDVFFLQEGDSRIFTILASDLKFNSVDFYSGVYKGKSADITLVNKCESDPYKKGAYIFTWLSDIVFAISNEFSEEDSAEEIASPARVIPLFEFSACAGDGFFIDSSIPHSDITDITGIADFAVTVVVDGSVMCKRYIKQGRGYKLVPDNSEHKTILGKDISSITYLGKVILV